jgi:hypothetical protein
MHLDERDRDVYNQIDPNQRAELDALHENTAFWQRMPKIGTIVLVSVILAIIVF